MDESLEVSLDNLPIKRLDFIDEIGAERFPADVGYDEKRVSLIRRVDFAWAVEREEPSKKQKKSSAASKDATSPWPWQSMVENLQMAHQELSVIIDIINTVEANEAVTVAGMTRPKLLPNEHLSDLAVSTATKLQCFRHLGKYFKQSAKALGKQVTREARFYGALIRLQQNWKVKRHRMVAAASGNEGFFIDLFDNSLYDPTAAFRPSSVSAVRVEHDKAGMLALNLASNASRTLRFGFCGTNLGSNAKGSDPLGESKREPANDDECVKETHSMLRKVHRAIFYEQVFDLVTREAFIPSLGFNVTGIQENQLQLNIGQEASVFISLLPSNQGDEAATDAKTTSSEISGTIVGSNLEEKKDNLHRNLSFPSIISCEIFLQQLFHEHIFVKAKNRSPAAGRTYGHPTKDKSNLLSHFCMSLAHRIFAEKVVLVLEDLVSKVTYIHLISHPTWHSRSSSWTLVVKVPECILLASHQSQASETPIKSQFLSKVVVNDDCVIVEGEGAPSVVDLFRGKHGSISSKNRYDCDLADLPVILMQQVASQVIGWLHEEALMVGIEANRDFLSLSFELEQSEMLGLVAQVDANSGILWWLVIGNGMMAESKLHSDFSDHETRKLLGYLSLDVLYSTLLDLISLCTGSRNH